MPSSSASSQALPLLQPGEDEEFEPSADGAADEDPGSGHSWALYKGLAFSSLSSLFFSLCTVIVKRLR